MGSVAMTRSKPDGAPVRKPVVVLFDVDETLVHTGGSGARSWGAVQDAVALGPRHREASRRRPGRHDQPVVADRRTVLDRHAMRAEVDRRNSVSEAQGDLVLLVPAGRMHEELLALGPALQVVLRQRRPFVRTLLLLAEEQDPPVVTAVSQRLRGLRSGQARSHDDERRRLSHRSLPLRHAALRVTTRSLTHRSASRDVQIDMRYPKNS
jgi:hypothetical protein